MAIYNQLGQAKVRMKAAPTLQSLLLDTYSGSAAAYSLRRLSSTYTGSAITVRRSSDNTSQQIGFDANGNLNTTALTTFVGANNTALYSEEFDNAWWNKNNVTVTANQEIAPDGTMTADLLSESGTLNHSIFNSTQVSWTGGISWSWNMSVYVKKGPGTAAPNTFALAWAGGNIIGNSPYVLFNISTGTIVEVQSNSTDTNFGYSIDPVGDGWFRCAMWGTLTPSVTVNRYTTGVIRFNANLNTITTAYYTGNAQANMYIWGWQLVRKANDTSVLTTQPYIKTTATAAGNGFVSTWFDQSGNGRNLTQATAANQPRIVNGGVIDVLNGKPSVYISSSKFMKIDFGTTLSQPLSYFNIGSSVNAANNLISVFSGSGVNITAQGGAVRIADTSNLNFSYTNNIATQRLIYALANTTTSRIAVNAATGSSGSIGTNGINGITLAAGPTNTFSFEQNHQEFILWNADKTTDRTGISNNINSYYSTY